MIKAEYNLKIYDIHSQIDVKDKAKKLYIKSLEDFYDVCIFNSITSLDLDVVIDGFINSASDWQKKFYARSMILIVHEHLEVIHRLMSSKFYDFLLSSPFFELVHEDIIKNRKSYKDLNKKKKFLHELRNNIIAHRNKNGEELFNLINNIDLKEVFSLCLELQSVLKEFVKISTSIVNIIIENFQEFYTSIKLQKL